MSAEIDWIDRFPRLRECGESAVQTLGQSAQQVRLPAGAKAFEPGAQCDYYLLVVSGTVCVQQIAESGREIVFESYASRIADLMLVVEDVAFRRVDVRLAERLLRRARENPTIQLTHQDLAVELGTAREVISRQLKEFERRGWVRLARGSVLVNDFPALEQYAAAV